MTESHTGAGIKLNRKEGKGQLDYHIIGAIQRAGGKAQAEKIFEDVKLRLPQLSQYPHLHKRTVQRRIKELLKEGKIKREGYYLYSVPDRGARRQAGLFGGHVFDNLWLTIWEEKEREAKKGNKGDEFLAKHLVKIFGVYMLYCFLEAARTTDDVRSIEDRMVNLRAMISVYTMYMKFVMLFRDKDKPIRAVSLGQMEEEDPCDLSEEIITKLFQGLKEQYPKIYDLLESSAEV